jgi:hypothetical protein
MGFRYCSVCDSLLFAAKAAALTTDGIILTWSCDACDHTFETREKLVSDPVRARAFAA